METTEVTNEWQIHMYSAVTVHKLFVEKEWHQNACICSEPVNMKSPEQNMHQMLVHYLPTKLVDLYWNTNQNLKVSYLSLYLPYDKTNSSLSLVCYVTPMQAHQKLFVKVRTKQSEHTKQQKQLTSNDLPAVVHIKNYSAISKYLSSKSANTTPNKPDQNALAILEYKSRSFIFKGRILTES